MVPVERIELPTFGLQNRCSTAELNRQRGNSYQRRRAGTRPPGDLQIGNSRPDPRMMFRELSIAGGAVLRHQ